MTATIAALATPPGRSAVAVIRLSGPGVRSVLKAAGVTPGRPRRACLRTIRGLGGETLDRGLALWFPAPHSYTGEDCAELHVHGGRHVVQAVLRVLIQGGARLAEPGEFTRRAFEHGKLDLTQAEAVADLVDAETAAQARQALAQLGGALSARHEVWRDRLTEVLARLEAAVDYPDEDLATDMAGVRQSLIQLRAALGEAAGEVARGEAVREGWRVAIIGAPNAGKSTLLNALAGRDAAIVTEIAGTTRDVIEAPVELRGYRVLLADMAGLRPTADPIEEQGVRRATAWATAADRRLWVVDSSVEDHWEAGAALVRPGDLCILNKDDLGDGGARAAAEAFALDQGLSTIVTSMATGGGAPVRAWLEDAVEDALGGAEFPAATRTRHRQALGEAVSQMDRALQAIGEPELAAEDVRLAARALLRVTGEIGVEDVLDRVFSTFCIGK